MQDIKTHEILYVTTNMVKIRVANEICQPFGISFKLKALDITEVQSADGESIARAKASEAFTQLQKPVVVSDDSWMIPALKNFPGPYMKYINQWFTAEDWLRLTLPLEDRRIILRQCVVYQDIDLQKLFYVDIEGRLLTDIKGTSRFSHLTITSFDDGKSSAAEAVINYQSAIFQPSQRTSWHDFAEWYNETYAK